MPAHLFGRKMVSHPCRGAHGQPAAIPAENGQPFPPIQTAAQSESSNNVSWLPGQENPANKCEMFPPLSLMPRGASGPGALRPLLGVCNRRTSSCLRNSYLRLALSFVINSPCAANGQQGFWDSLYFFMDSPGMGDGADEPSSPSDNPRELGTEISQVLQERKPSRGPTLD